MKPWLALPLVMLACSAGGYETSIAAIRADELGPVIAQNPFSAPADFATQHGDTGASDTSSLPGPGAGALEITRLDVHAACPSILPLRNGRVLAVCVTLFGQLPTAFLLDAALTQTLAQRALGKGSLFGGVYPFLDERERLVVADADNMLLRLASEDLSVEEETALPLANDHVVGLVPDYEGQVWFASERGVVGLVTRAGSVATLSLPAGELIANSIASAPSGVAVVSDHALYLLAAEADQPRTRARVEYDRGSARKPGQLSQGSGSTPTYFGPRTGGDFVAFTDNATPLQLRVVRDDGSPVCTLALPGIDGSEDSPIGAGRSVFVTSTYGYRYPALPAHAGPSVDAAFAGGLARIDVAEDEQSCSVTWSSPLRSAAVPKLSLADGLIHTVAEEADGFAYAAIDAASGALIARHPLAGIATPMQLAPTLAAGRVLLQGTLTSILRIAPR